MVESDGLSAVLNGCFLELLKVFALRLAAHERQAEANAKSCRPQSTTLAVLSKYSQYAVCALSPVCL